MRLIFPKIFPQKNKQANRYAVRPFIKKPKLLLGIRKSSLELVNTSAGVNKLLLTREEGMALGANINLYFAALGGSGFHNFATCASDFANFVIRMDSVFHCNVPLFKIFDVL